MAGTRAKDRKRRKRKEKHVNLRRAQSGSPYQRVGRLGGEITCYVNADWQTRGMASLICLRVSPGGGYAMAMYLVDTWCIGLKDAWGRLDITSEERAKMLDHFEVAGMARAQMDPDAARRLLAGAIRFTRQNGFKLPKRYDRWVAILGGVDESSADLSTFGKDGGLLYTGTVSYTHLIAP